MKKLSTDVKNYVKNCSGEPQKDTTSPKSTQAAGYVQSAGETATSEQIYRSWSHEQLIKRLEHLALWLPRWRPERRTNKYVLSQVTSDEIRNLLAVVDQPATSEAVAKYLLRLKAHKTIAGRSDDEIKILTLDYAKHLSRFSDIAVREAVANIILLDLDPFFPTLARLREEIVKVQCWVDGLRYVLDNSMSTENYLKLYPQNNGDCYD